MTPLGWLGRKTSTQTNKTNRDAAQFYKGLCDTSIYFTVSNDSVRGQWRPWADCADIHADFGPLVSIYRIYPIRTQQLLTILLLKLEKSLFLYQLMCLKYWWTIGKKCRPWSDAAFCGVWSGSTLFAQACLSKNSVITVCIEGMFSYGGPYIFQWDLLCEKSWVPQTITSMQMAGVLSGNLLSGQIADLIGRKPPLFLAISALVVLNIIAAFSVSWLMFAIIRFFIGFGIGVDITIQYNIQAEFALARWRTWIVLVPSWPIDVALFAMVAWLTMDWQYLHIATACVGAPLLATWW